MELSPTCQMIDTTNQPGKQTRPAVSFAAQYLATYTLLTLGAAMLAR